MGKATRCSLSTTATAPLSPPTRSARSTGATPPCPRRYVCMYVYVCVSLSLYHTPTIHHHPSTTNARAHTHTYTPLHLQAKEAVLAFLRAPALGDDFGEEAAVAFSRLAWGKPLQARVLARVR